MSLTQALNTAMAGLQVTQKGLSIVAGNVANVQTPDYVRKTLDQIETANGSSISVRATAVNRVLDQFIQTQVRTETSGGAYADTLSQLFDQLQNIYGAPGSSIGVDALFNNFTTALQGLLATPSSPSAQNNVINAARVLTQQLNSMSSSIQTLRSSAEQGIASDVDTANSALQQIAKINLQVASANPGDATAPGLMDQRDFYIDQLTKLMNVKVVQGDNNQVSIYTGNGIQLVGTAAVQLSFDAHGTLSPTSAYSSDPTKRSVGTITLTLPGGASSDLIAAGGVVSGEIGAYLQMRDQILPQAQNQLDEFAARMAQAASDVTTNGAAAASGGQTGFTVDTAGIQPGNSMQLSYTDALNVQHNVTIIRVDDPTALPLANSVTANPNDQVIGVDFSGGMASIVTQLTNALGATGLQFSNPVGTTLRVLNDVANTISVNSASTTKTMTSLTSGNSQLPLFMDGPNVYSGAMSANYSQVTGFAQRVGVNNALVSNPSNLVLFQTTPPTAAGDPTRPTFLYDQISGAALTFSPTTGIGGVATPFSGPLSSYIGQVMAFQGQAADNAKNLKQGQDVVVNALQARLNQESGVNIDEEMTSLLNLQNAYGANARVFTVIKEMFAMLQNM
jgi:flagellar hook-associated protein 1 FlgK